MRRKVAVLSDRTLLGTPPSWLCYSKVRFKAIVINSFMIKTQFFKVLFAIYYWVNIYKILAYVDLISILLAILDLSSGIQQRKRNHLFVRLESYDLRDDS